MPPRQPERPSDAEASDAGSSAAENDSRSGSKPAKATQEADGSSKPAEEDDRVAMYLRGPTAFTA